jgi:hypothetical protein
MSIYVVAKREEKKILDDLWKLRSFIIKSIKNNKTPALNEI